MSGTPSSQHAGASYVGGHKISLGESCGSSKSGGAGISSSMFIGQWLFGPDNNSFLDAAGASALFDSGRRHRCAQGYLTSSPASASPVHTSYHHKHGYHVHGGERFCR